MSSLSDIDRQIADLMAQKQKLLEEQKTAALKKVEDAITALNALGLQLQTH